MKKKIILSLSCLLFVALIVVLILKLRNNRPVEEEVQVVCPPKMEYGLPIDSFCVEEYTVGKNEYMSQILYSLGAKQEVVDWVSCLSPEEFDVRSIKPGQTYKAFFTPDSTRRLCFLVYEKSPVNYTLFCIEDSLSLINSQKDVLTVLTQKESIINSSLWNAAIDSGIPPMVALQLSDVYAWTIDFFGVQKGDRFSVVYDELYVDSTCIGTGRIHAANFFHADKDHFAFYYEQDSVGSYWDKEGNSLKRAFLKAPLQYSRISSHFSYARRHPVLRTVRPHTGVDYAAPSGTPVMTIGDGVVIEKGYKGGGGHTVKIRHNSVYTTAYLHLSKYGKDIKSGTRVKQGDIIGYVGSTGLSTGPHLDFRVWQNGKPVNPLTIESPPVEPVSEANKLEFDSICSLFIKKL